MDKINSIEHVLQIFKEQLTCPNPPDDKLLFFLTHENNFNTAAIEVVVIYVKDISNLIGKSYQVDTLSKPFPRIIQ